MTTEKDKKAQSAAADSASRDFHDAMFDLQVMIDKHNDVLLKEMPEDKSELSFWVVRKIRGLDWRFDVLVTPYSASISSRRL
jgi:hypothetical protein